MPYFHLILRAIRPESNLNRVYEIWLDRGLFESWLVLTAYGRYGGGTTQKNHSFSTLEDARAFIDKTLSKRLKAEKRIGCDYKIVKAELYKVRQGRGLLRQQNVLCKNLLKRKNVIKF